jgi:hypothetical protein
MYGNTGVGAAGAGSAAGAAGVGVANVDPTALLPHTGLQLIWFVLVAVMLISVGFSARRLVRRDSV